MNLVRFGPAGNSESFSAMGYKKTVQVPEYLEKMGLNAYEYQCGRGVRVNVDAAAELGRLAAARDIAISLHAPYFISLSSTEEEKRENSIGYILDSARAVAAMGGSRIVVHSGSCSKMTRQEALELACATLRRAEQVLCENGLEQIHICPETMGKVNQLGTLEEVLELCRVDDRFIPCIDFGHLNARTFGGLRTFADFKAVFDAMEDRLGRDRMRLFHSHFSRIEYTENGGEKRHLTFEDKIFGPDFEPVAELVCQKGCTPTIICESAGTQAEDAAAMREMYRAAARRGGTV
ncbi:MAG: TIM barrel protein [Oscillospiraceae bacterium]|nr:TIM barrel protein [Oscillospiraceae bacterium]MDY4191348.1 TIM barrel protein [Oscillospiraceae bacterium]